MQKQPQTSRRFQSGHGTSQTDIERRPSIALRPVTRIKMSSSELPTGLLPFHCSTGIIDSQVKPSTALGVWFLPSVRMCVLLSLFTSHLGWALGGWGTFCLSLWGQGLRPESCPGIREVWLVWTGPDYLARNKFFDFRGLVFPSGRLEVHGWRVCASL